MRPRSIRSRLMLWYIAILGGILLLFGGAVYFVLGARLQEQLDDALENRAFFVAELVTFDASGRPVVESDVIARNPDTDDTFQRVFDASGEVVFDNSASFASFPVDGGAVAAALDGQRRTSTQSAYGEEARVLTVPLLREDGSIAGALQVGESTGDLRETQRSLLLIFAAAAPIALALASVGGWWLSSRALAPIDRVTRTAAEIGEGGDLSRRIGPGDTADEVARLARTFDEMLARLEAAFARQRQFTADASHELRTPLTAIRGQIDVALERPRDVAEYQRVLAAVNAQVARMTRLVGGLLMLARSESGALPLHRERIDLGDLVRSVAEQVTPLARAKGLAVEVEGDGASPADADEDLLLQLMLNLTDNAIKYTSAGTVALGWREGEMWVRDTGPGVPAELRERVFERFYRVDAARSGEEGAGLGLAICRWIAESHGGSLSLESSPQGSTFTVRLPERGGSRK